MPRKRLVNSKSSKRGTRAVKVKQEPQKYCPQTMMKFDDCVRGTIWMCRICLACLLDEESVRTHESTCFLDTPDDPGPSRAIKFEDNMSYICQHCNRIFSRHVALKYHLTSHEKSTKHRFI